MIDWAGYFPSFFGAAGVQLLKFSDPKKWSAWPVSRVVAFIVLWGVCGCGLRKVVLLTLGADTLHPLISLGIGGMTQAVISYVAIHLKPVAQNVGKRIVKKTKGLFGK